LVFEQITSLQNTKVKLVNRLRSKRGREQENLFVIDYERDLERAIEQGYETEFILYCPDIADESVLQLVADTPIYDVPQQIMNKVSYRENSTGIVAVMRSKPAKGLSELQQASAQNVLGLVDLRKPGNMGALLRTADATEFDAIILVDMSLDLYNPNIIRSSTGACFLDNIHQLDTLSTIDFCKSINMQVVAAYVNGNKTLYDVNFRQKTAIMLGTEDKGLSQQWVTNCDELVNIPMAGRISDSLNVSVSGAIFMYEALRQRNYS
jgi:RNA methyltransferase, TrmH family